MKLMSLFLLLAVGSSDSATGWIHGAVTGPDGAPVAGALVEVDGAWVTCRSGPDGAFLLAAVPAGTWAVTVSIMGGESVSLESVPVISGTGTPLDIVLPADCGAAAFEVEPRVNTAILMESQASVSIVLPWQYGPQAAPGLSGMLAAAPSVVSQGTGLHARGGRAGETAFLVDGVQASPPGSEPFGLALPVEALESTVVTRGGAGAEAGGTSGTVADGMLREPGERWGGSVALSAGSMTGFEDPPMDRNGILRWQNEPYRSDLLRVSASAGGPAPLFGSILPGSTRALLFGTWHESGRDGEDSRGEWDNNALVIGGGGGRISWVPSAATRLSLSVGFSRIERGWSDWLWSRYGQPWVDPATGDTMPGTDIRYGLPERVAESGAVSLRLTRRLGDGFTLDWTLARSQLDSRWRIEDPDGGFVGDGFGEDDWLSWTPPETVRDADGFYVSGMHSNPRFDSRDVLSSTGLEVSGLLAGVHGISAGFQGGLREVDQFSVTVISPDSVFLDDWEGAPYTLALYCSDRISSDGGFTATAGLRAERFDADAEVLQPAAGGLEASDPEADYRISPRISAVQALGARDALHFSWGHYYRMPDPQYLYSNSDFSFACMYPYVGNPGLDPERTVLYEIGFRHLLWDDAVLDITGYQREISGLVQTEQMLDPSSGEPFYLFVNGGSFWWSRGLEVTFSKPPSDLVSLLCSLSWSVAKGRESRPSEAAEYWMLELEPSSEEAPLDWNMPFKCLVSAGVHLPQGAVKVGEVSILGRTSVTISVRHEAGLPYANAWHGFYEPDRPRNEPDDSYPAATTVDLHAEKRIGMGATGDLGIFARVYNLFDEDIVSRIADVEWYEAEEGDGPSGDPAGPYRDPRAWAPARHVMIGIDFRF